ncbi:MAG: hypothetical protein COV09_01330 [Candidatus Vogelbacteria bacterium CG10_big_fil_rev_8_21_14_0_10_50_13]|uniref:DUF11 domain-containing protein n=1 Tax=Candidatus Vogelbacteria bacterium CG10_big_fil_rev_8_21_14_0_10_50_13 TaxID=1975044 RepID=A0A2H0RGE4_9BACT|nr:MAG: hypothetical protein COV09_01330 [Candidatus Vogelbacteria bacterium CG10_big_fil_rev_8_21_14_0_10_50_13]
MADNQPFPSEDDGLADLDRELYERGATPRHVHHSNLAPRPGEIKRDWNLRPPAAETSRHHRYLSLSVLSKVFLAAGVFFMLSLLAAGFLIFRGGNIVSNANIDIDLTGPLTVKSGGDFDLGIAITNKNRTDLETADLVINFPEGTRDPLDVGKDLPRLRRALSEIKSGQTKIEGIQAILFGQEKTKLEIEVLLEYRLRGSDAIFEKSKIYEVQVADSPVSINVNLPLSANVGREIELGLEVVSNSPTVLSDLVLAVIWPPGFTPKRSSVTPTGSDQTAIWRLGDLPPGGRRTITVVGELTGQNAELKSFQIQIGLLKSDNTDELAVIYTNTVKTIQVERPFVGLAMTVNDSPASEPSANLGQLVQTVIDWGNNLPVPVTNGQISLSLKGPALRESSVTVQNGSYSSTADVIVWDQVSVPALARLDPGDRGTLQASFASFPFSAGSSIRNPYIDLVLTFRGERQEAGRQGELVETVIKKTLKLSAVFQAAGAALYYNGPFANTGPLPPKVDTPTTYTVVWQLATGGNDVREAQMFATVPRGVRFAGEAAPSTEKLVYDATNRILTWEAGYLPAGSRGEPRSREVVFQVEFIPSANQTGNEANLLENIRAVSIDTFTGEAINRALNNLTTILSTDANFNDSNGIIVQ